MEPQFSGGEGAVAIGGLILMLAIALFFFVLGIVIWWKIFSKAGYSGALGLLMLIPVVNFILLLVLAFGEWPIQRELRSLQGGRAG
jgi:hypothetical protein